MFHEDNVKYHWGKIEYISEKKYQTTICYKTHNESVKDEYIYQSRIYIQQNHFLNINTDNETFV